MRGRACVLSPTSCGSSRAPDRVHPCSVGILGKKNNSNYDSRPLAGVNSELFIITQRYYLFSWGFGLRGAVYRGFMLLLPLRHSGRVLAFYARPPALPAVAPSALKGTCVLPLLGHAGRVLAFYARPPALPAVAPSALKGTCVIPLLRRGVACPPPPSPRVFFMVLCAPRNSIQDGWKTTIMEIKTNK